MIPDWVALIGSASALLAAGGFALRQGSEAIAALAKARAAKVAAEAAKDQAEASAVQSVVERVDELEAEVKQLRSELEEERGLRSHWEEQVWVLKEQLAAETRSREAAEEREGHLAREMSELRLAIHGSHQTLPTPMLPKPMPDR